MCSLTNHSTGALYEATANGFKKVDYIWYRNPSASVPDLFHVQDARWQVAPALPTNLLLKMWVCNVNSVANGHLVPATRSSNCMFGVSATGDFSVQLQLRSSGLCQRRLKRLRQPPCRMWPSDALRAIRRLKRRALMQISRASALSWTFFHAQKHLRRAGKRL